MAFCTVQCLDIHPSYGIRGFTWRTIHDGYIHILMRSLTYQFDAFINGLLGHLTLWQIGVRCSFYRHILHLCPLFAKYLLLCFFVPHLQEDILQFTNYRPFQSHVDIMPFANVFQTNHIIVCNVHTSCIARLAINDHNLSVVSRHDMVHPREADGVKLHQIYTRCSDGFGVYFLQRLVIR